MTTNRVADLSIDEFRALIQETIRQTISEMLKADPNLGAKLSSGAAAPSPVTFNERLLDEPFAGIPRGLED